MDIDVVDPGFAPGTGTPEPGDEVRLVVTDLDGRTDQATGDRQGQQAGAKTAPCLAGVVAALISLPVAAEDPPEPEWDGTKTEAILARYRCNYTRQLQLLEEAMVAAERHADPLVASGRRPSVAGRRLGAVRNP